MGSSCLPNYLSKDSEPIPGYVIRERLGTGGYGEVWKAEAPGGLQKAIKFVYGHHDDVRAARELKSLIRLREVRHPFLLSVERIEVVDGHLIIVTELAEESLKDLFERYRANGSAGIPQDVLLALLRDAADALDYLNDRHSLQHLDVKPENLLLIGNRIKVADFGMLKDIEETSASIVGGLTPVYAPPEVFDGRPGRFSDQYSLAIVYQHMLTGELPFDGRTTAQLAAQHLHSAPVLSALPSADQAAVARALSKNPEKRFANCRSFIDALLSSNVGDSVTRPLESRRSEPRKDAQGAALKSDTVVLPNQPAGPSTRGADVPKSPPVLDTQPLGEAAAANGLGQAPSWQSQRKVVTLEPIDLGSEPVDLTPTIFLGIGGIAGRALQRLRRRLHDRFGAAAVDTFQMVLLDTDGAALNAAVAGRYGFPLRDFETVALPLRKPKDYRAMSKDLLKWISRRWLYNIPLSLQTEGIRPLGRLAFVEHATKVAAAVRWAVTQASAGASITAAEKSTGLSFRKDSVRVLLVSSISGGAGSGMAIDVAYLAKHILNDLGIASSEVSGILTHATDRKISRRDLSSANAFAFLRELQHFTSAGNAYPGEPLRGVPGFKPGEPPFDTTTIVHLGDELGERDFGEATDSLAEYLYLKSASPASKFFDKARELEGALEEPLVNPPTVRTFGLCQIGSSQSVLPHAACELICKQLVCRWKGTFSVAIDRSLRLAELSSLISARDDLAATIVAGATQQAATFANSLKLQSECLLQQAKAIIEREVGADQKSYLRNLVTQFEANHGTQQPDARPGELSARLLKTVDEILGLEEADEDSEHTFHSLRSLLDAHFTQPAAALGDTIRNWILSLVDDPQGRITGAQHAADWFAKHLSDLDSGAAETILRLKESIVELKDAFLRGESSGGSKGALRGLAVLGLKRGKPVDPRLVEYFRLRTEQVGMQAVGKVYRWIRGQITAGSDQLKELSRDLNRLAEEFNPPATLEEWQNDPSLIDSGPLACDITTDLWNRQSQLVAQFDRELEAKYFATKGKLREILTSRKQSHSELPQVMRMTARHLVLGAMKELSQASLMRCASQDSREVDRLGDYLERAIPRLLACGGAKRLLCVLPDGINKEQLQEAISRESDEPCSVVCSPEADAVLCYEAERIPLPAVADHLIGYRRDFQTVASRLHTRIDIDWDEG